MYRILADENVDHRIVYRLGNYGHDLEHVDTVDALGKETTDEAIAAYLRETNRLLLTNDDDFLREFDDSDHHGLLFIETDSLSSATVADIVHEIAQHVPREEIQGTVYVSESWL